MKTYIAHGKGKAIAAIAFFYFTALGASLFATGSAQSGSGQYKQFNYIDSNVSRHVRTEYTGYYLKEFSIKSNGTIFVVKGNYCPWDGEYTGWEDLVEERIPYGAHPYPNDVLEGAAKGVELINVTEMGSSTFILEATPNEDGDYWWWTTNGTICFFKMYG
jgi:hypothetical protein